MRTASLEAYADIPQIKINRQERDILRYVLTRKDATRREIAHKLGMETSTVSARANRMLKYGVLEELSKRKCSQSKKTVGALSA